MVLQPSSLRFVVDLVLVPDILQTFKGCGNLGLLLFTNGNNQRVDDGKRCHKRVNKGRHLALCKQQVVCLRGDW